MARKRTTVYQTDIARALGLSQGTVSLALREDPRVSGATIERVANKAREMGYRSETASEAPSSKAQGKRRKGGKAASRRVDQARIARELGVSQTTVSMALSGKKDRVAKATREAILAKAAQLAYVPDPHLVALSQRRRSGGEIGYSGTLAWLTNFTTKDGWKRLEVLRRYRSGVAERAAELGYQVEDFWLGDPSRSYSDVRKILLARGIRGLILAPQEVSGVVLEFDFSDFAAVSFGYTLSKPLLPRVGNNVHNSVRLAYRRLLGLGYTRIALALPTEIDSRVDRVFSAGFLSMAQPMGAATLLQPFLYGRFDGAAFASWFERWSPDAILSTGETLSEIADWLLENGVSVGDEFALAELSWCESRRPLAGVDQLLEHSGGAAVDAVRALLLNGEYGVPAYQVRTWTEGIWRSGESARGKAAAGRAGGVVS